jgi:hypothetical protein
MILICWKSLMRPIPPPTARPWLDGRADGDWSGIGRKYQLAAWRMS